MSKVTYGHAVVLLL